MKLILASQSLGRKKLLELLKIPFEIIPSTLDEDKILDKTPLQTIRLRAKLKGVEVFNNKTMKQSNNDIIILSADSGVILGKKLIGKPKDYEDAVKIMKKLSGKTHRLVTAVSFFKSPKLALREVEGLLKSPKSLIEESTVTFRPLSDADISAYLSQTDYTRYAGGYALFDCPFCRFPTLKELTSDLTYRELLQKTCKNYEKNHRNDFISEIKDSLSNVIGLPLEKLHLSLDNHS